MIKYYKSIAVLIFCFALATDLIAQKVYEVDVCVYGGTSAGVIAAYTAKMQGKKVILIEPGKHLGGMSSGGLGYTDIGNKYAITGLAREFYRRIGSHYGKFEQWIFEPKVAETIFNDYVKQARLDVLYNRRLKQLNKEGTRVSEIGLEQSDDPAKGTTDLIKAKMFIDCGYEGDLMAQAGISYAVGREDNKDYNETINGVQLMEGHQFPDGIDPYVIPGKPASGLVWGVSPAPLATNGTGDKKVQAYNFRICLSTDPANQVPVARPEGYDSTHYELLVRLFKAFPEKQKLNDYLIVSEMPNNKTDINNRGGFSSDMIGMNYEYPDGTYEKRAAIVKEHERYTKGLLYFLGHDPRVPQALRKDMLRYGYPKDEYTDNNNWSPQLYVREARRMIGAYVMSQANCEAREVVKDGVGMAAYTMDSHNCQRVVVNGMVKNEGNVEVGGFGPYPISYGSIVPRQAECTNVFVPVCLSATHIAYGSIRMEPVFMVLAQSAATAAVMAIDTKVDIQKIDIQKLQDKLKKDPLVNGKVFEILVDNDDKDAVQINGSWARELRGGYGPSYLVGDNSAGKNTNVRFNPMIPVKGQYEVFVYVPKIKGISDSMLTTVSLEKEKITRVIKESEVSVQGQTSGEWVSLGKYYFSAGKKCFVEISSAESNGKVVADAVIWVPR
ncbi:FAD-dependent oxidoreductase [Chryseosolibacter indicus]|uniref:FAD-dependent oxidoreductase n=1 Tax=Chryseosolibacter indicus TaxID=2782351 RepID=A0ABS5VUR2_9BACT|nr:FAD-dependent oxidoreductase [Chryseosolibacter indicus]MBT1705165.1 FAD-dependent oxidoreductase [Chryseosolibacter indicus]